jgi:hypothetical protein
MAKKKAGVGSGSAAAGIRRELAASALRKRAAGEMPTRQETAALKAVEREEEERKRWEYYESIPQKHWREMSGRQTKQLAEQAARHRIPFGGRTINLPDVVRALHDFLARNALKLAGSDDDDPRLAGTSSPALEEFRRHRARLAELEVSQQEGQLLVREVVHEALGQLAAVLRRAGELLDRKFGREAHKLLADALEEGRGTIDRLIAGYREREESTATGQKEKPQTKRTAKGTKRTTKATKKKPKKPQRTRRGAEGS